MFNEDVGDLEEGIEQLIDSLFDTPP